MNRALWLLLWLRFRAWQRRLFRNAGTPRGALFLVAGVLFFALIVGPNIAFRVGWAGGPSHFEDMKEADYGLRRTVDRHPNICEIHYIGADMRRVVRRAARFTPWAPKTADYYRLIDFDIGIAPLRPGVFTDAKSYIKALEYAALGIPVVASDVTPYRDFVLDGVTGWLVRGPQMWAARLRDLVNDTAMRTEMGAKAKTLAAGHTIQTGWTDWETAYRSVL